MPRRELPSLAETQAILSAKRTRPSRRPPPHAGKALAGLVKALDERFGQGADGLKARWREVAGEALAARTEPVKLIKGRGGLPGTLEIKVDGPAAALIQHQAPEILARVKLFLGDGVVDRLRIVQGPIRPKAAGARGLGPDRPLHDPQPVHHPIAQEQLHPGQDFRRLMLDQRRCGTVDLDFQRARKAAAALDQLHRLGARGQRLAGDFAPARLQSVGPLAEPLVERLDQTRQRLARMRRRSARRARPLGRQYGLGLGQGWQFAARHGPGYPRVWVVGKRG